MPTQTEQQRQATFQAAGMQPAATAPVTPTPQIQTPAAPAPTPAPAPAPVQVNVGTQPPTETAQPKTATQGPLAMPSSGSVVDLLNAAGQDSSYESRQKLAQQYGIQGYSGTAAQNVDLSKKYLDAYNAQKNLPTPETGAAARGALDTYFNENLQEPQEDPQKSFFDTYMAMNPIIKTMYDTIHNELSTPVTTTSFKDEFAKLQQEQGIPALNTELMNIRNIMDGTEDDIRNEITKSGGFATDSQVQALAGARNKTLLKQANILQRQLALKEDYVDQIMQFSEKDRAEVDKEVEKKLGLTEKLAKIQETMTNAAKENYLKIIDKMGYSGLSEMIGDNPSAQKAAESFLGLTPGSLTNTDFLALENKSQWSEPYKLGGDIVQKNLKTGEIKTSVNVSGSGYGGSSGGKLLSVEEATKLGVPYGTTQEQAFGLTPKKPLGETQTTDLTQAQIARNNVRRISQLVDELGEQGPVIGRFRKVNPYDTRVVELQNLITQTVPGLARGIFKEVGVLTDQDVERYTKTLANPKLTKEQAKIATDQLLETINYSINTQLSTYDKAGRDVRDFDDLRADTSKSKSTKMQPGTIIKKGNKTYEVGEDGSSLTEQTGKINWGSINVKK